jgi:hypothetical protein
MAALTMYPMFDYGELPPSRTQSDGHCEADYEQICSHRIVNDKGSGIC